MKPVYRTVLMAVFIALASLALLSACGGSDSDSGGGAGESGDGSGSGGGDTGDTDGTSDEPTELAAQCSKNPAGSVQTGQNATATYSFNQSLDGTATINTFCPGVNFQPTAMNIENGQGSETVQVHDGCAGQTLTMTMNVDGEDVSAQCAWDVSEELGLTF